MFGTFRWNLAIGLIGFVATLILSAPQNIMKTALMQSGYSFLFLFLFTYLLRWLLGTIIHTSDAGSETPSPDSFEEPGTKGQTIDLATPDEKPAPVLASSPEEAAFAPLNPPKLSTKLGQDPEEMASALRRMTEK
ncbi:MAG: hypothetical protein K0R57_3613 [Paenibacillaceae bacterium]|jgi:hypothetical protein|nr:hypothetical protein [Paenibacillaceae bacterium]